MHEKRFNPEHLERLDSPERRQALPPEKLLQSLDLKPEDTVLDLGAGTGYFAIPAAKIVENTVYALDVQPKMLETLQSRVEQAGVKNVELLQGPIEHIPMNGEAVNHVIASLVLHEVEPLEQGVREIHRVLKPQGTCMCLEWEKKETEQGPPLHHRIASSDLEQVLEENGFQIKHRSSPTSSHYLVVAQKL
ncbi:class I SAM-dependent methyltransferase [Alicyclobacillus tolerans]|uniref:class I SAM-dependent methyltransferase n=1 Tax=Alicyclobacillus tolerans TaxID=90970 RepID=UPI001F2AFB2B|nr:class I SAM-dependent methyltransferase [Alicyclobacillus tolerans]MCF8566093.1 class I SAM-dependent methyltransferase [Alicyclobacillus tolerans]